MLIDLSSTNGCFVNGRRVREHYLRDGDLIAVGHHQMRFTGPSARAQASNPQQHPMSDQDTTLVPVRTEALERTTSH
jgi:pSer/pThr/pTyr-binding forkhead associated (FHA) protein